MKDAKIIFSPQLANFLLKKGFSIIKLKPKHDKENETVFVFSVSEGFFDAVEAWKKENPENRANED